MTGSTLSALVPGSFDPFHNGHLEVVERACALFSRVVVAPMTNPGKGVALFDQADRMEMIRESTSHLVQVEVTWLDGLVVEVARRARADVIVKGLRAVSDFENELQMAQMNRELSGIDTLFVPTSSSRSFISSRLLREVARLKGDVSSMVPKPVAKRLAELGRG
jgi:pantetheine-phosphate adenylyltransferase